MAGMMQLPSGQGNLGSVNPQEFAIPQEYQQQIDNASRSRQLAQLMLEQGLQGPQQGQMVSGYYVKGSPLVGLANGVKQYLGSKGIADADVQQQHALAAYQNADSASVAQLAKSAATAPGQPGALDNGTLIPAMASNMPRTRALATALATQQRETMRPLAPGLTNPTLAGIVGNGGFTTPPASAPADSAAATPTPQAPTDGSGASPVAVAPPSGIQPAVKGPPTVTKINGIPFVTQTDSKDNSTDVVKGTEDLTKTALSGSDGGMRQYDMAMKDLQEQKPGIAKIAGRIPLLMSVYDTLSHPETFNNGPLSGHITQVGNMIAQLTGQTPDLKDATTQTLQSALQSAVVAAAGHEIAGARVPVQDTIYAAQNAASALQDPRAAQALTINTILGHVKAVYDHGVNMNQAESLGAKLPANREVVPGLAYSNSVPFDIKGAPAGSDLQKGIDSIFRGEAPDMSVFQPKGKNTDPTRGSTPQQPAAGPAAGPVPGPQRRNGADFNPLPFLSKIYGGAQ